MKKNFHPTVHADSVATCMSCGAKYPIPSTVKVLQIEVCSACHPVYTGEYRGIVASGRVDRFRKVKEASEKKQAAVKEIAEKRKSKPSKVKKVKAKK